MNYTVYKRYEDELQKEVYEKFKDIKYIGFDDDLSWSPIHSENPLSDFTKIHGLPICKIKIWVFSNPAYDDGIVNDFAEYSYYIFYGGLGKGFIPTKFVETLDNWLKMKFTAFYQ
jgi:hypothetical protein